MRVSLLRTGSCSIRSKALPAFTLLELLIVMIVSGLLLSMMYLVLEGTQKRYTVFSQGTQRILSLSLLQAQLSKDVERAQWLRREGDCLWMENESVRVAYCLQGSLLLRTQASITDTFFVATANHVYYWEDQEQMALGGPIDAFSFVGEAVAEEYLFTFRKQYSARERWQIIKMQRVNP